MEVKMFLNDECVHLLLRLSSLRQEKRLPHSQALKDKKITLSRCSHCGRTSEPSDEASKALTLMLASHLHQLLAMRAGQELSSRREEQTLELLTPKDRNR